MKTTAVICLCICAFIIGSNIGFLFGSVWAGMRTAAKLNSRTTTANSSEVQHG